MTSTTALHTPEKITLMRSMIPFLLERGPVPIPELAEHFAADEVTVRKIVQFFGLAGIPGESATYQHQDLFDIDWDALEERDEALLVRTVVVHDAPQFSAREVAAFIAGLQYLRSIPNFIDDAELTELIRKLVDASQTPHVAVDVSFPHQRPELAVLHRAAQDKTAVKFAYITRAGTQSIRRVFPLQLESLDDVWYLRAWCTDRRDERLFRVDRMSNIAAALADRDSIKRTDLIAGQSDAPPTDLRLAPDQASLQIAVEGPEDRMSALRLFEPEIQGNRATIRLADMARAWDVATAAPGHLRISEPEAARASVVEWAAAALAQYDE